MKRLSHQWKSESLGKVMHTLVFGDRGIRMLAFPPRIGKAGDYEYKGVVDSMAHSIDRGMIQLICLDSVDDESFYCASKRPSERIARHLEFERYVLDEVIPFTHQLNPNPCAATFGCSLGAYHAMNIALRHPSRFQRVVAFSGRYDVTTSPQDFWDLLDGHRDQQVFENSPSQFLPLLDDPVRLQKIRLMHIRMTIGRDDPFLENTRAFSAALSDKGVVHELHEWAGRAHRFSTWRRMAQVYF